MDKIDNDGDGFVTLEEMRNWIRFTHDRFVSVIAYEMYNTFSFGNN